MKTLVSTVALVGVTAMWLGSASANEFRPQLEALLATEIAPWLSDATVVDAVKASNAEHAGLSDGDVEALDKTWREEAESGSGPLIDRILGNELSTLLSERKAAMEGKVSEMFVMDNRGLNVGQSDITSDFWQGDEDKWQKTYAVGPDAVFIDEVEFDDSAEAFLSQVSKTIVDPQTGEAIGAITVGVNVENLF
ncbi:hypothetical protein [Rhodospira trueperi]|uniref:Uncharacterized protein n=1 Tax=Rhodospira trueperi TaxID=69960 RepID=A0A1G6YU96_9PROT|nr:hypothetical protein [Rhodospira trueperi]SDD93217.1 hypothetical protein SAMN05421720_102111 [Rhodospira trueperi]